ncbi:hypothetical protein H634G_01272 [Metarhizium anisopliae BRIP 53293]|uniref:Uncharacterized protein n=1 Tax=Metarhizium anisopliae BRIP 53293 TaxID=1291518 RepID=A0A0D9PAI4_METAN|nr:hypothetical protein H634G_01272 [Metarhizium anisopliae BRIP 53293]KJK94580.1 hypothetical protein H633G_01514 [Metarhizium anisopliae BRIP 53284]
MQVWEAVEDEAGLTKDCENSAVEIPLISRVLEAAEMCLADVSEEPSLAILELEHFSETVKAGITIKLDEPDSRRSYGEMLWCKAEIELTETSEETYL